LNKLGVDKIDIALVEGSGLTDLSDHLFRESKDSVKVISFSDIPHCPIPTAIGHKQDLLYSVMQGRRTIIWTGRIHYYEGYRATHQAFQAHLSGIMGCSVFISTNAAGYIN
jgi:purine-nucleoside phosphorylase